MSYWKPSLDLPEPPFQRVPYPLISRTGHPGSALFCVLYALPDTPITVRRYKNCTTLADAHNTKTINTKNRKETKKKKQRNQRKQKKQFSRTPAKLMAHAENSGNLLFWVFWFSCNFLGRVAGFPRAASCAQGVCVRSSLCANQEESQLHVSVLLATLLRIAMSAVPFHLYKSIALAVPSTYRSM